MSNNSVPAVAVVVVLLMWLTMSGVSVHLRIQLSSMKKEAVERGYAQYNPKTGEWEWLPSKLEKP